jgi:hypothetical protein
MAGRFPFLLEGVVRFCYQLFQLDIAFLDIFMWEGALDILYARVGAVLQEDLDDF